MTKSDRIDNNSTFQILYNSSIYGSGNLKDENKRKHVFLRWFPLVYARDSFSGIMTQCFTLMLLLRRREPEVVASKDEDNAHNRHECIEQSSRETSPCARMQRVQQFLAEKGCRDLPVPAERPGQTGQTHTQQDQRNIETSHHMQVMPETTPAVMDMDHEAVAPTLSFAREP